MHKPDTPGNTLVEKKIAFLNIPLFDDHFINSLLGSSNEIKLNLIVWISSSFLTILG